MSRTLIRAIDQALAIPATHVNHAWTPPDDFEVFVEDCPRCEGFIALGCGAADLLRQCRAALVRQQEAARRRRPTVSTRRFSRAHR